MGAGTAAAATGGPMRPGAPSRPSCRFPPHSTQSPGCRRLGTGEGCRCARARDPSKHMPVSACIVCFMFLYLHLYIYNFIKKRKSHFDPFLEQGQGCCCPLGASGATPEWVKFWEGWWPRKGVRCCVGISADVCRGGGLEMGAGSLADKHEAPMSAPSLAITGHLEKGWGCSHSRGPPRTPTA